MKFIKKKKIFQNFLLVFIAVYISLISIEFFLKQVVSKELFNKYIFDIRSRNEVLYIENKLNKTVNFISPQEHLTKQYSKSIFPLSGISNVNTLMCIENGYWVKYKSDENGFNNKSKLNLDTNLKKILLIGDSFAHGQCVKDSKTISGILSANNFKAINRAYSGTGPLIQYATLVEYIKQAKPDHVIWIYFENDLDDLIKELKHPLLSKYLNNNFSQNLINNQKKIDILLSKNFYSKQKKFDEYFFTDFFKLHYVRFYLINALSYNYFRLKHRGESDLSIIDQKYPKNLLNQFFKIINKAKNLSELNQSKFHFVYIPIYLRYKFNHDDTYLAYDKIISYLEDNQIEFTDLVEEFKKKKEPISLYSFKRGHFTDKGYAILTKNLLKDLGY